MHFASVFQVSFLLVLSNHGIHCRKDDVSVTVDMLQADASKGNTIEKGTQNSRTPNTIARLLSAPISSSFSRRGRQLSISDVLSEEDYNACNSEFIRFGIDQFDGISERTLVNAVQNSVEVLSFYIKFFVDQSEEGEYFGPNGEYTTMLLNLMEEMETFWTPRAQNGSSSTNPVDLVGAHGNDLSRPNLIALCNIFAEVGLIPAISFNYNCNNWADDIDSIILEFRDGYANPIFTSNAAAVFPSGFPLGLQPYAADKSPMIIIGDGVLEFISEFSSVDTEFGADFLLGHEYCHVLQVVLGILNPTDLIDPANLDVDNMERIELMCDATSAYFLAHSEGANLSVSDVDQVTLHAMTFGDGLEDDEFGVSYHGTPGQRECAAVWGATVAKSEGDSEMRSFNDIANLFNDAYASIYEGSASVCADLVGMLECSASTSTAAVATAMLITAFTTWVSCLLY